ncbi:Heme exporter protein C, partial [Haemophilus influenzae]
KNHPLQFQCWFH